MNISRYSQPIVISIVLISTVAPIVVKATELVKFPIKHPEPVGCMCNGKKVPARLCPFIHCADV